MAGTASEPFIQCKNVSKVYLAREGRVHAVSNVSLDVQAGEFISILGPSGCGKSTLLKMIAGLLRHSSGQIFIGGERVRGPYTNLGFVFQQDLLMEWATALENVLVQPKFRGWRIQDYKERARELLASVGLQGFENKYPFELSGGMRQRVSICRSLVHDPPLLMMDEPFGALDALTREQLNMDLQRIWEQSKKTVLFVTHSITEAVFLADRVVVMTPRPGRILEIVNVDLERPRPLEIRDTGEFGKYVSHIRKLFYDMGLYK